MIIASGIIGGRYSPGGVNSNGTGLLTKASDLSGIADGKQGTVSFWVKTEAAQDGVLAILMQIGASAADQRFRINKTTGEALSIVGARSGGGGAVTLNSSTTLFSDNAWHHVLASWDTSSAAACLMYIDDSDVTNLVSRTDAAIDYTRGEVAIGGNYDGSFKLTGDLAEFWFDDSAIDISSATNRRKFTTGAGLPELLGSDGSKPTGTAPLIYLRGPAANWGTNAGSGGNFSVTGTFADAATKPSY